MAQFGPHAQARLCRIAYCLLRSLVKHSCINPKFLTFDYLDEKPVDTGLMKFLGLSFRPVLVLGVCLCIPHLLGPFYDQHSPSMRARDR
ncbi:hypothetical protein B296_00032284 [Ensete ventricosum]|uniref:Uncharacterized protein n=1 Tax=Ensete ventricosum TaxID=4639 RepID=A0A426X2N5_ENSVE|nr:hypothetical protein B296_00032284 [Ensete ventricosum]